MTHDRSLPPWPRRSTGSCCAAGLRDVRPAAAPPALQRSGGEDHPLDVGVDAVGHPRPNRGAGMRLVDSAVGRPPWCPETGAAAQVDSMRSRSEMNSHAALLDRVRPQNIPLSFAEVSGITWSTSQCSTTLPSAGWPTRQQVCEAPARSWTSPFTYALSTWGSGLRSGAGCSWGSSRVNARAMSARSAAPRRPALSDRSCAAS